MPNKATNIIRVNIPQKEEKDACVRVKDDGKRQSIMCVSVRLAQRITKAAFTRCVCQFWGKKGVSLRKTRRRRVFS